MNRKINNNLDRKNHKNLIKKARNSIGAANQPMTSGKAEVQSANPPSNPEPDISAISKLHESQKQAEGEPRNQHYKSSLKKHGLRLREPPERIEGENGRREASTIAFNSAYDDG